MPGLRIVGSGRYLPGRPYTNHDLARVMDTNDEWIQQRTGIVQRYFSPAGQGPADLVVPAARAALEDAGLEAKDLDYILFNTMTPDHVFPGSAVLLGAELGAAGVPALDLRAQCAAFVYTFQVADALLKSGVARRILLVGAEAHAALMPWQDWDVLEGTTDRKPSPEAWQRASAERGWAIIFGDGAGALVVERDETGASGVLGVDLHTDGRYANQLLLPVGFKSRPWVTPETAGRHFPSMQGREVFKHAVTKLPRSVRRACEVAETPIEQIDWFIAHQANLRINDAICDRLNVPKEKCPSNIDRYGNTSGATIPILVDEMRRDGRIQPGQRICFLALGAGLHWGSLVLRV